MTVLTAFAALSACRFGELMLRQDDSVDGSLLPGAAESAFLRAMTNAPGQPGSTERGAGQARPQIKSGTDGAAQMTLAELLRAE